MSLTLFVSYYYLNKISLISSFSSTLYFVKYLYLLCYDCILPKYVANRCLHTIPLLLQNNQEYANSSRRRISEHRKKRQKRKYFIYNFVKRSFEDEDKFKTHFEGCIVQIEMIILSIRSIGLCGK